MGRSRNDDPNPNDQNPNDPNPKDTDTADPTRSNPDSDAGSRFDALDLTDLPGPIKQLPGVLLHEGVDSTRRMLFKFGGGFYGAGTLITYIYLTVIDFVEAWQEADGVVDFFLEEFLFRFGVDAVVNVVLASIWPVYVIDWLT